MPWGPSKLRNTKFQSILQLICSTAQAIDLSKWSEFIQLTDWFFMIQCVIQSILKLWNSMNKNIRMAYRTIFMIKVSQYWLNASNYVTKDLHVVPIFSTKSVILLDKHRLLLHRLTDRLKCLKDIVCWPQCFGCFLIRLWRDTNASTNVMLSIALAS